MTKRANWPEVWQRLCASISQQPRCPQHPEYPCVRTLSQGIINDYLKLATRASSCDLTALFGMISLKRVGLKSGGSSCVQQAKSRSFPAEREIHILGVRGLSGRS